MHSDADSERIFDTFCPRSSADGTHLAQRIAHDEHQIEELDLNLLIGGAFTEGYLSLFVSEQ
jgi:hypothetical protein